MAHDVFISHSVRDKAAADAVCAKLESRGIRCWIAPRDIRPGMSWGSAILEAIDGARVMLLVFSSRANRSPQISREVERAVSKNLVVVPVRVEDVKPTGDLEYFLGTPHWLDAVTPPFEQHLEGIADSIKFWIERIGNLGVTAEDPLPTLSSSDRPNLATDSVIARMRSRPKWIVPSIAALAIALVGVAGFFGTRRYLAQKDLAREQAAAAPNSRTAGAGASPSGSPAAEASQVTMPSIPGEGAPPSGFCSVVAPRLGTGQVTGLPVETEPCDSDVAECARDLDSCRSSAQQLDAEAAAQLGYLYMNGLGVERDYTLARNWSLIAAAKGNPLGQDTMGRLYLGEGGEPQDYRQAQGLFAKAAAQDCALAENDLGDLYLNGYGVERNLKEAFKWYKKAADHDDAIGQSNLGLMYLHGWGVNKDLNAAKDWNLKSAKQGNAFAQDSLGYMYETGQGVVADPAQAFQCYKTAAEQGYATSQIHLAELYKKGIGVPQNSTEAARWYCKAAGFGNVAASLQVQSMGADCSSLPVASAESSPAADAVSSPSPGAVSAPASSAESP